MPAESNAELIVRAVNCHDELVAALRDIMEHVQDDDGISAIPVQKDRIAAALAILAKAKGAQ